MNTALEKSKHLKLISEKSTKNPMHCLASKFNLQFGQRSSVHNGGDMEMSRTLVDIEWNMQQTNWLNIQKPH